VAVAVGLAVTVAVEVVVLVAVGVASAVGLAEGLAVLVGVGLAKSTHLVTLKLALVLALVVQKLCCPKAAGANTITTTTLNEADNNILLTSGILPSPKRIACY
jgi:hypothetical protein